MKHKSNLAIYSCIWGIAVVILIFTIIQNAGDAKVVNYSGIVRGATQKIIKEELQGIANDEGIAKVDAILENLKTGEGEFNLTKFNDTLYQSQLMEITKDWSDMKEEILRVRNGEDNSTLFKMSEDLFEKTNAMVTAAEEYANRKLVYVIMAFFVYLCFSIGFFTLWNRKKKTEILSIKYQDEITGIPNFHAFKNQLEKFIEKMGNQPYVIIHFDIDDFKVINNTYGYQFGTKFLTIIAEALTIFTRNHGLCARVSSDNFLVLVRYDENCIDKLKEMLYKNIQKKAELNIADDISFSIGACVFYKKEITDYQKLLDNANLSHKNAKQNGRGQVILYNETFMKQLVHENMILKRMHSALENQEYLMYLQPKFHVKNGKIIAAEALCRWKMPDEGLLPPNEFIPLFENNGIIYELDFYMLSKACRFLKEHHLENTGFTISVNFSRVTIYHKDFYHKVMSIIDSYGIPVSSIEIEITESAFNGLDDSIIKMLMRLQKAGFSISIDDFGTGYSTLNLLNTLPVNVLKIDRTFIDEVDEDKNIIGLIIGVAHTLDIKVVCEGIETQKQLKFLRQMDCDYGQGYYISVPIEADEFYNKFLKKEAAVV